jgi:hypothetical protein
MAEDLTPREREDVSKATSLAENGNGSRLRDLVHDDKDFAHHTKIIKAMLNLNSEHLHALQFEPHTPGVPDKDNPSHLKLNESTKTVKGEQITTRSLAADGRTIYREVYNNTTKTWEDSGSTPVPSGFVPPFVKPEGK